MFLPLPLGKARARVRKEECSVSLGILTGPELVGIPLRVYASSCLRVKRRTAQG